MNAIAHDVCVYSGNFRFLSPNSILYLKMNEKIDIHPLLQNETNYRAFSKHQTHPFFGFLHADSVFHSLMQKFLSYQTQIEIVIFKNRR